MKKYLFYFLFLFVIAVSTETFANVYASGLRFSDDTVSVYENALNTWDTNFNNGGIKLWFVVNEAGGGTVSAVVTVKSSSGTIRTLNITSAVKGVNSVVWDGYDNNNQPAPIGNYWFEVTLNDPVGHAAFDSLWVAGAYWQGPDFDGGTSYAYRGNASVHEQSSPLFGNVYVARGTSSANGIYELRGDGVYIKKIATAPDWLASTPNELWAIGNNVFGLAGYGYTNGGYLRMYDGVSNELRNQNPWGTILVRGLFAKISGTDTSFYTCRSGSGVNPSVIKMSGISGDTSTVINLKPYILGNGYVKQVVVDDENFIYVIFGEASASRKKIAKFSPSGNLVALDSLDGTNFGGLTGAYFHSLAIYRGANLTSGADDKIYALVYGGANPSPNSGLYSINPNLTSVTNNLVLTGVGTGATSLILNTDPAGNIIWSNGNNLERIMTISPASGPNSLTTTSPSNLQISVTNPVPVALISFSASIKGDIVTLNWTTATEINNHGFEIEKSVVSKRLAVSNWETIGFVKGVGTSSEKNDYFFTDKNLFEENLKIKYRLKQIDFDGSVTLSNEIEVDLSPPNQFSLEQNYPNPFNPNTSIRFTLPVDGNIMLKVFAINGELVRVLASGFYEAGNHTIDFNAGDLSSGTYIYQLSAGNVFITKKMMLLK